MNLSVFFRLCALLAVCSALLSGCLAGPIPDPPSANKSPGSSADTDLASTGGDITASPSTPLDTEGAPGDGVDSDGNSCPLDTDTCTCSDTATESSSCIDTDTETDSETATDSDSMSDTETDTCSVEEQVAP